MDLNIGLIRSTIEVKHGFPLSPTSFGIYIDDMEKFLGENTHVDGNCILHHFLIVILLFVNELVLLSSSLKGLQRLLDALANFFDLKQMVVNLTKIKVVIFNTSKESLKDFHFYFFLGKVEVTTTYSFLGE